MRHVPWITLTVTVVFFLSPHGQDLLRRAFVSGEQLANSIAQFMLLVILGIVIDAGVAGMGRQVVHPQAPGVRMMVV